MSNIPEEMLQEIFIRLPVKSLLRFKCVGKALCSLIRSRSFINMHHNLISNTENNTSLLLWNRECMYSTDYNSLPLSWTPMTVNRIDYPFKPQANYFVDFVYACTGLLCISSSNKGLSQDYEDKIHLWNPSTSEYKKIPAAPQKTFGRLDLGVYGFGYEDNIDTYKLVRVIDFNGHSGSSEVDIYTIRSDSWKSIRNIPYYFEYEFAVYKGVLYNGALHWHAITIGEHFRVLISFDIANESFGEVALPKELPLEHNMCDVGTGVLGGCLCLLFHSRHVQMDVWMMQDYEVRGSWTESFSIAQESVMALSD